VKYVPPNQPGSVVSFPERYDNFIGGKWMPPVEGEYFDDITPVTGRPFVQAARSRAADIELALDAAHGAGETWGRATTA
jgi:aldehyde dehydrogenase